MKNSARIFDLKLGNLLYLLSFGVCVAYFSKEKYLASEDLFSLRRGFERGFSACKDLNHSLTWRYQSKPYVCDL